MKFIKLEILNLASLDREEGETIHFTSGALGESNIFSIVGPTGSGKSTILDLNAAISEKDNSRRAYIAALYNYWSLYYTLRSMTLYDFERNTILTEDYHLLIE